MKFDLMKFLRLKKEEQEFRKITGVLEQLLGLSLQTVVENKAFLLIEKVIDREDASRLGLLLIRYAESTPVKENK